MKPWQQDPRRAEHWKVRRWAMALRAVAWLLTLPLVLWAISGEWAEKLLFAIADRLPRIEVRR